MPFKSPHQNEWKIGMFESCCAAPGTFCLSCFCPWCTAYNHREILIGDGEYYCCGGLCPVLCLKSSCPRPCLICEVCLCLSCAVSGNRMLVQNMYQKANTPCDNCILWCTCLTSWVLCILSICGVNIPPEANTLADCLYCTVLGCMQTQHAVEMGLVSGYENVQGPPKQAMQY